MAKFYLIASHFAKLEDYFISFDLCSGTWMTDRAYVRKWGVFIPIYMLRTTAMVADDVKLKDLTESTSQTNSNNSCVP